jgi:hypothetical protein
MYAVSVAGLSPWLGEYFGHLSSWEWHALNNLYPTINIKGDNNSSFMKHEPDLEPQFTKLLLTFSYIRSFLPTFPHNNPSTLVLPPFSSFTGFCFGTPNIWDDWKVGGWKGMDFRGEDGLSAPFPLSQGPFFSSNHVQLPGWMLREGERMRWDSLVDERSFLKDGVEQWLCRYGGWGVNWEKCAQRRALLGCIFLRRVQWNIHLGIF